MITPDLRDYIKDEFKKGSTIDTIKNNLKVGGWLPGDIDEALIELNLNNSKTSTIGGEVNKSFFYIGLILLLIGLAPILSVFAGGIGLILFYLTYLFLGSACNVVCGTMMMPLKFFGNLPLHYNLIWVCTFTLIGIIFLITYRNKKKKLKLI